MGVHLHILGPFSPLSGFLFIVAELVCCPAATLHAECRSGKVDATLCCKSPMVTKRMPLKSSNFLFNFH